MAAFRTFLKRDSVRKMDFLTSKMAFCFKMQNETQDKIRHGFRPGRIGVRAFSFCLYLLAIREYESHQGLCPQGFGNLLPFLYGTRQALHGTQPLFHAGWLKY